MMALAINSLIAASGYSNRSILFVPTIAAVFLMLFKNKFVRVLDLNI